MTDDERKLLIKTAQALGGLASLLSQDYSSRFQREYSELNLRIQQVIAPLVLRLARPEDWDPPPTSSGMLNLMPSPPFPGPATGQFDTMMFSSDPEKK